MEKKHGDAEIAEGTKASGRGFEWEYLAGSNLKSQLTYPNDAVVTWSYEPHRDLLTAVTNATYSTYVYANDLLGRRTSKNDEQYGYNVRDELISADNVSYAYDDIGNRTTAEGKTYTANNLNQYIAIDDFTPQYDADGNQTLIKTETGVWSVVYNAENRPIRWQSGDTVITMVFDRMGRRVEMRTVKDGEETLQRFVYDNYLCILQLRGADNALFQSYIWDPTEPIATRPLVFLPSSGVLSYYFHDGNKNVSDLVDIQGSVVHYDYTPFGSPTASSGSDNPYRFSSEMLDEKLGLFYYNFRHYLPIFGRWSGRDCLFPETYLFCSNNSVSCIDILGLRKEMPLGSPPKSKDDCPPALVILIGGFGDDSHERVGKNVYDVIKNRYPNAKIAYYYWRFLKKNSRQIAETINTYLKKCYCTRIALIGHSFGGATAAEVFGFIEGNKNRGLNLLITLDPVGVLSSAPSLKDMDVWINVYVPKGVGDIASGVPGLTTIVGGTLGWMSFEKNSSDWVASMGGKWGRDAGATRNLPTNEPHENAAEMLPEVWTYLDAQLEGLKRRETK